MLVNRPVESVRTKPPLCIGSNAGIKGVDTSHHFSMYAFEGGSGGLRWKHEGTDFQTDAGQLQDSTTPQHDHRLDAEHLAARHHGESSCRDFRESVLVSMPHG